MRTALHSFCILFVLASVFGQTSRAIDPERCETDGAPILPATAESIRQSVPQNQGDDFQNAQNEFADYVASAKARGVSDAMLPFALVHPEKTKKTILLIHGLADSPGTLRELGQTYYDQGYNVVAVLLKGHGTNYKDLKNAKAADWKKDVDFGASIAQRLGKSEKISVLGYSLGGTLAVDLAHRKPGLVSSEVLLAPLVDFNTPLIKIGWFLKLIGYTQAKKKADLSLTAYPKFTAGSVMEAKKIVDENKKYLKKKEFKVPTLVVITEIDKNVRNKATRKLIPETDPGIEYLDIPASEKVGHLELPTSKQNPSGQVNVAFPDIQSKIIDFAGKE